MMPDDFRPYAELWQEQIDPAELAELQAMAKNIARTARWKRLIDFTLVLTFIGAAGFALWTYPASTSVKFGFALAAALMILWGWKRHRLTRASQATAIQDQRAFFRKTIENVRSELRVSTISFCLMAPALVAALLLISALRGVGIADLIVLMLHKNSLAKTIFMATVWVAAMAYFIRDNIRLREQLRRLESMSREWDE